MKRNGFALWELLAVLCVLGIVAVVVWTMFAPARENGHGPSCRSNLKSIGLGRLQYQQDFNDHLQRVASSGGWILALDPYIKSQQIYFCPQSPTQPQFTNPRQANYTDYWLNRNLSGADASAFKSPATLIVNGDGNDGQDLSNAAYSIPALPPAWIVAETSPLRRHQAKNEPGGANYAFADGHVKWLTPEKVTIAPSSDNEISLYP